MNNGCRTFGICRLGTDPRLEQVGNNQTSKASLNLVFNRRISKEQEFTCFVNAECWGAVADFVGENYKKGDTLFIEGVLDFQQWEREDGSKASKHIIKLEKISRITSSRVNQDNSGGEDDNGNDNRNNNGGNRNTAKPQAKQNTNGRTQNTNTAPAKKNNAAAPAKKQYAKAPAVSVEEPDNGGGDDSAPF